MSLQINNLIDRIKTNKITRVWLYAILGLVVLLVLLFAAITANQQSSLAMGASAPGGDVSYTGLLFNIIVKLAIVILLIYVTLLAIRRWQVGKAGIIRRQMTILETTRLSPHQAIHLVQLNQRRILIGATDQSIRLICEVEPLEEPLAQIAQPALEGIDQATESPTFASLLVNRLLNRDSKSSI
jgi:flagellar biosynthetic protein FliO